MNFQFDKINIADMVVIVALSISLFASIYCNQNELSMSIAAGLLGYIGGAGKHMTSNSADKEDLPNLRK